jgi:NAD(P)H-dependent FMN reductase
MRQYQIAVVVGSLRRDSFNRKLAASVNRIKQQIGTALAQLHLRNVLAYLDACVARVKRHTA